MDKNYKLENRQARSGKKGTWTKPQTDRSTDELTVRLKKNR